MQFSDQCCARPQVETLMQIAAVLAELTTSLTLAAEIPAQLRRALGVDALTLAIVHDIAPDDPPRLFFRGTAGLDIAPDDVALFDAQTLAIYEQSRMGRGEPCQSNFDDTESCVACSEMALRRLASYPKSLFLGRVIDHQHSLLLIVHQPAEDSAASGDLCEMLPLIANQLARLLGDLLAWLCRPADFGDHFGRLTNREWMVLRGLNSDVGEKQLADDLGLSPHTLHSHIKSIYRKTGVQGRLPLLAKVQAAFRTLRAESLRTPDKNNSSAEPSDSTVAAG